MEKVVINIILNFYNNLKTAILGTNIMFKYTLINIKICNNLDCSAFYIINELNRMKNLYKLNINYSDISFYLEMNKAVSKENLNSLNINASEWVDLLSNKLFEHINKIEKSKVKKVDQVNNNFF